MILAHGVVVAHPKCPQQQASVIIAVSLSTPIIATVVEWDPEASDILCSKFCVMAHELLIDANIMCYVTVTQQVSQTIINDPNEIAEHLNIRSHRLEKLRFPWPRVQRWRNGSCREMTCIIPVSAVARRPVWVRASNSRLSSSGCGYCDMSLVIWR